jgi:hypothetical protein
MQIKGKIKTEWIPTSAQQSGNDHDQHSVVFKKLYEEFYSISLSTSYNIFHLGGIL